MRKGRIVGSIAVLLIVAPASAGAKLRVDHEPPIPPDGYWVVRVGLIDPNLRDVRELARRLPSAGFHHPINEEARLDSSSRYLIYPICGGVARPEYKPVSGAQPSVRVRCR